MDPFSRVLEISVKLDKRHAIKAILGFLRSEPVLKYAGINVSEGTLCEA